MMNFNFNNAMFRGPIFGRMATKTSTETRREIVKKGDVIIVKEVETITTTALGKEPEVKEVTRVEEFKGEEGFKRLPEDIRRQLEKQETPQQVNKEATKGKFVTDCLAEHNKYRKMHGVDPLKLSEELVKISKERASELAQKDEMSTRTDHTYGENLSCLWSSDPNHVADAAEIVSRWYSESKNYNYDEEPKNLNSGHFTQLVWRECKEFGVGAAKSESNRIYVVATYSPPGNFSGEFRDNVFAPGGKPGKRLAEKRRPFSYKTDDKPGGSNADDGSLGKLNDDGLEAHNEYRKKHGVPPLVLNEELIKHAQQWADELARIDKMQHRKDDKYGENLYSFKSTDPKALATAAEACKSWYSEIHQHDFNTEPKHTGTGHFTQMIWKNTKEVGMGRAKSKSGLQIIVANYNPPGNFVGQFREMVPKPVK